MRNRHWIFRGLKIASIAVVASAVFGYVVEHLWNWLMPPLFGSHLVTFWQGLGLFVLAKILFGGVHRHGGHRGHWRGQMAERLERLTPEEREQFRTGMRGCGGRFGGRRRGPADSVAGAAAASTPAV